MLVAEKPKGRKQSPITHCIIIWLTKRFAFHKKLNNQNLKLKIYPPEFSLEPTEYKGKLTPTR